MARNLLQIADRVLFYLRKVLVGLAEPTSKGKSEASKVKFQIQ